MSCQVENQIRVTFSNDSESGRQKLFQIPLPGKLFKVGHNEILGRVSCIFTVKTLERGSSATATKLVGM